MQRRIWVAAMPNHASAGDPDHIIDSCAACPQPNRPRRLIADDARESASAMEDHRIFAAVTSGNQALPPASNLSSSTLAPPSLAAQCPPSTTNGAAPNTPSPDALPGHPARTPCPDTLPGHRSIRLHRRFQLPAISLVAVDLRSPGLSLVDLARGERVLPFRSLHPTVNLTVSLEVEFQKGPIGTTCGPDFDNLPTKPCALHNGSRPKTLCHRNRCSGIAQAVLGLCFPVLWSDLYVRSWAEDGWETVSALLGMVFMLPVPILWGRMRTWSTDIECGPASSAVVSMHGRNGYVSRLVNALSHLRHECRCLRTSGKLSRDRAKSAAATASVDHIIMLPTTTSVAAAGLLRPSPKHFSPAIPFARLH
nr:hypothetical protein CFP56_54928 [Quercus suber]